MKKPQIWEMDELWETQAFGHHHKWVEYSAYEELTAERDQLKAKLTVFEGMTFSENEEIKKLTAERDRLRAALERICSAVKNLGEETIELYPDDLEAWSDYWLKECNTEQIKVKTKKHDL